MADNEMGKGDITVKPGANARKVGPRHLNYSRSPIDKISHGFAHLRSHPPHASAKNTDNGNEMNRSINQPPVDTIVRLLALALFPTSWALGCIFPEPSHLRPACVSVAFPARGG